jgi:hypothetical protein
MLTVPLPGTEEGATKTPIRLSVGEGAIVPVLALPPAVPFTSHVNVTVVVVLGLLRVTFAVKSVVTFNPTLTVVGVIEMELTVTAPLELPLPPPQDDKPRMPAIARIAKNPPRILDFNGEPSIRRLRVLFESTTTLL